MKWGFTGSQDGAPSARIISVLDSLKLELDDLIVTGGCIGVDSQIFHAVRKQYPTINQLVIFPADLSKVDSSILPLATNFIQMPKGTDYRDRNERLVLESDKMVAFWTGRKRSGTYMTMNIAKRASKLSVLIWI